jgi:phage terminase large subunit-like protein
LHLSITNAGDDEQSVCYRQRQYCKAVMSGEIDDPTYYGKIYAATREEAEAEIESVGAGATRLPVAAKCNPGLGTIIKEEALLTEIKQALHVPSNMPNLLRFLYCVWRTAAEDDWLGRYWDSCGRHVTLDDLVDTPVWLGLDMSSTTDLTALAVVGRSSDRKYWVIPTFWVPRQRANELRKWTAIEDWEKRGWIRVVPGQRINQSQVAETICKLCRSHDVRALMYDPREATAIVQTVLDGPGVDVVPFKQSHENYHAPTDEFEAAAKSEQLYHDGNPILAWQVKHAWCKATTHGYKKPIKPDPLGAPHKTVDGVQAAIMALSQAMFHEAESEGELIYEFA